MKWSKMPRCTAGVMLTATDTIASPRAECLQVNGPEQSHSCRALCLPMPCHQGASTLQAQAQLHVCGIPSRPQLCQGLHLVISFPCLGWLLTVPKHQKKAASKAKPHQQNPEQSQQPQTQGPAPDFSLVAPQMLPTVRQVPFQVTQEKFKGEAPEAGGSSCQGSSLVRSPGLSCFLFPMSRSSL